MNPDLAHFCDPRVAQASRDGAVVDFRLFATDDPQVFPAFERFRGKDAFDAFARTPESGAFVERLKPLLAAPLKARMLITHM